MLDNYTNLRAEILSWMNRNTDPNDPVIVAVPTFIALAEAEITRRLRRYTSTTTIAVSSDVTPIPAGIMYLRSARLVTGSPSLDQNIQVGTAEILNDFRAFEGGVSGRPKFAAIYGGNIHVVPTPDTTYNMEIVYYQSLVPLSATNPTNSVLTDSPDVYLFGALKFAESFMEHDERIAVWSAQFEKAMDQLEIAREREEFSASIQPARNRRAMR